MNVPVQVALRGQDFPTFHAQEVLLITLVASLDVHCKSGFILVTFPTLITGDIAGW